MNPILRNILAVVLGWVGGSAVNMNLVNMGSRKYPIEGVDPGDMEALAAVMPTLGSEHFIFPFLAHALGTLIGATIAGLISISNRMRSALIVGGIFLLGGIAVNIMITGRMWFTILDILVAYIPMAFVGGKIAQLILGEATAKN